MRTSKRRGLRLAVAGAAIWVAMNAAMLPWLPTLAAPSVFASSGEQYALVFGTLWGARNRPVYGVHMKLRRADEKKFRWEAVSDHRGEFAFRVPAAKADYVLVADVKDSSLKGEAARQSKDQPLPQTSVHVEGNERVDVSLHLAGE
jgi:hypothetical protein